MLASSGERTPPTIWQTFFFGARIAWTLIDPEDDFDLVLRDLYPLHQRADHLSFARPGCLRQPVVNLAGKVFQAPDNQPQLGLQRRVLGELLALRLQVPHTLAEAGDPGLKLLLFEEPLGITIDQPCQTLLQLAQLDLEGRILLAPRLVVRLRASLVLLGQPRGVRQQ